MMADSNCSSFGGESTVKISLDKYLVKHSKQIVDIMMHFPK